MLTDIEIAAQAKMKRITDVAAAMGIRPEELEPYAALEGTDYARSVLMRQDGSALLLAAESAHLFLP